MVSAANTPRSKDISETCNDASNGDRFVSVCRADVRYVNELRTWLVWSDGHWRYDSEGQMIERAKKVAREIFAEAGRAMTKAARDGLSRWASASLQSIFQSRYEPEGPCSCELLPGVLILLKPEV